MGDITATVVDVDTVKPEPLASKVKKVGIAEAFGAIHGAGEVHHTAAPSDAASQMPKHMPSFYVVVFYSTLTVSSFTICLPTSARYMASFGAPPALVGVLVGLTPFFSGFAQPLLIPVFKRLPLKTLLFIFCGVNIVASAMYALGELSTSVATVLVARCLMGFVGGPSVCSTFVARAAGVKARSACMQRIGVGIGIGYALGPLLGVLTELVCNAAGWTHPALNGYTAPGWLMIFFFFIEMLLLALVFQEPRSVGPPPSHGPKPPLPWSRLAIALVVVYIAPINVGAWDINTIFRAQVNLSTR